MSVNYKKEHVSILCDSRKRNGGSNTKPFFNLSHQIRLSDDSKYKQYFIVVHNAIIPKTYFEVNSTNNVFKVAEQGAGTITITIEPGNYTITELLVELETQLDAASSNNYTLDYDPIRNSVDFLFSDFSTDVTIQTIANGSTLNEILGFGKPTEEGVSGIDNAIQVNATVTYEGLYSVEQVNIPYLEILTSISSNNYYDNNNKKKVAVRIPTNYDRNDFIVFENHDGHESKLNKVKVIDDIELTLVDHKGRQIDLRESPWSCEIIVKEITKNK